MSKENHIPDELPLKNLDWSVFVSLISKANRQVARFDGLLKAMPNPGVLLTPLTTQEAVLSSRIEGTQATLEEVFKYEGEPDKEVDNIGDIQEVLNYRKAMFHAIDKLDIDNLPLSTRLIKNIHEILMQGVRGKSKDPGKFRTGEVVIGPTRKKENARYIPPPPNRIENLMKNFDNYLNHDEEDVLVQLGIIHAQFEMIHPFWDGNGRVGRILLPLFLYYKDILSSPMFYLSAYFESDRGGYYNHLAGISENNDWESWIKYFLVAVIEQSEVNIRKANEIHNLYDQSKERIVEITSSKYSTQALDALFTRPVFTTTQFIKELDIPRNTASRLLNSLEEEDFIVVVRDSAGNQPKKYAFPSLISIIE